MAPERKQRRSSILKPPKARNPLSELDLKQTVDDDGATYDRNKRVSFSTTQGIALFRMADHGNTIWDDFFEETNKNLTCSADSGLLPGGSIDSVDSKRHNDDKFEQLKKQIFSNDSFKTGSTFAGHPVVDDNDDEDHCVIGVTEKRPSLILKELTNPSITDHTEALINYKIKDADLDDSEMSITEDISKPIQEIALPSVKTKPKSTFVHSCVNIIADIKNKEKSWIDEKENIQLIPNVDDIFDKDNLSNPLSQQTTPNTDKIESLLNMLNRNDKSTTVSNDKRKTIIFDPRSNECNMSMTMAVPSKTQDDSYSDDYDVTLAAVPIIQFQNTIIKDINHDYDSKLEDVPILKSTMQLEQGQYSNQQCDMSITMAIPSLAKNQNQTLQKTIIEEQSKYDMSMTMVVRNDVPITQYPKIIVDDIEINTECDMSTMNAVPIISNNKKSMTVNENDITLATAPIIRFQKTIIEDKMDDCDMSITTAIPSLAKNQNQTAQKTIIEEQSKYDMSMTMVVRNDVPITQYPKTIVDDIEINTECDMSTMNAVPIISNNKKSMTVNENDITLATAPIIRFQKTIIEDKMDDCDMSITTAIPSLAKNQNQTAQKTIIEEQSKYDMSMTMVVRNDVPITQYPKMIVDDIEINTECDMSTMNAVPIISNNKKSMTVNKNDITLATAPINRFQKTIIEDKMDDCDMSITMAIPSLAKNQNQTAQKTIIEEQSKYDMSMTMVVRNDMPITQYPKTIVDDIEINTECDMSMMNVAPIISNNKKSTTVNEDVITLATAPINRFQKTIIEDKMDDCDMSITMAIPSLAKNQNQTAQKTIIEEQSKYDMSMTMVVRNDMPITQYPKTIVDDIEINTECDMSMMNVAPIISNNKKSTTVNEDVITLATAPINRFQKTIIEDKMDDCDMSITTAIPSLAKNQNQTAQKTIIEEQPKCDMSMTMVVRNDMPITQYPKMIVDDIEINTECDISMTNAAPIISNNKKSTTVNEDDITLAFVPIIQYQNTIIDDKTINKIADCDMSMTVTVPSLPKNQDRLSQKTFAHDQSKDDLTLSAVPIIQYQKTIVEETESNDHNDTNLIGKINNDNIINIDTHCNENSMMITDSLIAKYEEKIKDNLEERMTISTVVGNKQDNKINNENNKTVGFNTQDNEVMMDVNPSAANANGSDVAVPNVEDNEEEKSAFVPQCTQLSTTVENEVENPVSTDTVPQMEDNGNQRRTIGFTSKFNEASITAAEPLIEKEREVSVDGVLPITEADNEKRKTIVFDSQILTIENEPKKIIIDNIPVDIAVLQFEDNDFNSPSKKLLTMETNEQEKIITDHISANTDIPTIEDNENERMIIGSDSQYNEKSMSIDDHQKNQAIGCEMSCNKTLPTLGIGNEKCRTVFDAQYNKSSNIVTNLQERIIIDNISIATAVPHIEDNKKEAEMSMAKHDNRNETCEIPMEDNQEINIDNQCKEIASMLNEHEKKTVDAAPPPMKDNKKKRRTIVFDSQYNEMSITATDPSLLNDKSVGNIYHDAIPMIDNHKNKRRTIAFDSQYNTMLVTVNDIDDEIVSQSKIDDKMVEGVEPEIPLIIDDNIEKSMFAPKLDKCSTMMPDSSMFDIVNNEVCLTNILSEDKQGTPNCSVRIDEVIVSNEDKIISDEENKDNCNSCVELSNVKDSEVHFETEPMDVYFEIKKEKETNEDIDETNNEMSNVVCLEDVKMEPNVTLDISDELLIPKMELEDSIVLETSDKRKLSCLDMYDNVAESDNKRQRTTFESCSWIKNVKNIPIEDLSLQLAASVHDLDNFSDISLVNSSIEDNVEQPEVPKNKDNNTFEGEDCLQSGDSSINHTQIIEDPIVDINEIKALNLNVIDCLIGDVQAEEWSFLLLNETIRLKIKFESSVEKVIRRATKVISISLAPCKNDSKFKHSHILMKNQLSSTNLNSLCSKAEHIPDLLKYCVKTSSNVRNWECMLQFLNLVYGMESQNDVFTFNMLSGYLGCIWRVDIGIRNLPYASVEDVTIKTIAGSSPITQDDFQTIVKKIEPDFYYLQNIADELHRFVKKYATGQLD